jgi:hypothetical protein
MLLIVCDAWYAQAEDHRLVLSTQEFAVLGDIYITRMPEFMAGFHWAFAYCRRCANLSMGDPHCRSISANACSSASVQGCARLM